MKSKTVGFALLLIILITSILPVVAVQGWSWTTYPPPTETEMKEAVAKEMIENHPELQGLLDNYGIWEIELAPHINGTRFKLRLTWVDEDSRYDLMWFGLLTWSRYSETIHVMEFYYDYDVTIVVEDFGPGTTQTGTYHVSGGTPYSYTAQASKTLEPDDYYFRFVKWEIFDGVSTTYEYGKTCSGIALVDLEITAIFETRYMSHCTIRYEDGLEGGYLWRDDHVVLAVEAQGSSTITVTILSDYGAFQETYTTSVRSFNIYFSAERFVGDYILSVTAVNGAPYNPDYILAGREGILD